MTSGYDSNRFQAFAIDVWDGGDLNAQIFIANSQIPYPYLMFGGINGIMAAYNCTYDLVFVIGGDGVIIYRGAYQDAAVQAAIDQGIADLNGPTAVDDTPAARHRLLDGYPNPFNPRTSIPYELAGDPGAVGVNLQILDVRGRVVRNLVDEVQATGRRYETTWNGTDDAGRRMPSGAYLARLTVGDQTQARLLTLVK